jgi:hypothetical protein
MVVWGAVEIGSLFEFCFFEWGGRAKERKNEVRAQYAKIQLLGGNRHINSVVPKNDVIQGNSENPNPVTMTSFQDGKSEMKFWILNLRVASAF